MGNEIKDNSITVNGDILSSTEKLVGKDDIQVVEVKVRIPASELDGKRDAFSQVLRDSATIKFMPNQLQLDTDPQEDSNPNQTELVNDGGKK